CAPRTPPPPPPTKQLPSASPCHSAAETAVQPAAQKSENGAMDPPAPTVQRCAAATSSRRPPLAPRSVKPASHGPAQKSLRRRVPARLPLLVHSSRPCAASVPLK